MWNSNQSSLYERAETRGLVFILNFSLKKRQVVFGVFATGWLGFLSVHLIHVLLWVPCRSPLSQTGALPRLYPSFCFVTAYSSRSFFFFLINCLHFLQKNFTLTKHNPSQILKTQEKQKTVPEIQLSKIYLKSDQNVAWQSFLPHPKEIHVR